MSTSPIAFYKGAAAIMATDLATTPRVGIRTQLCGDAHLANFGGFGTPERNLDFDVNDFDETLPGPFVTAAVVRELPGRFAGRARARVRFAGERA